MEPHDKYKRYDSQFIESIIQLIKVDHLTVAEVADKTGLRRNQIYRWLSRYDLQQARQDPHSEVSRQQEYLQLRQEN
jgi:transposase-like protein